MAGFYSAVDISADHKRQDLVRFKEALEKAIEDGLS
jgi:hypothetical protein